MRNFFDGKAKYVMIGGFLGAGKTSAIAALAKHLTDMEMRVGLISNDQSTGLVDTGMLRSCGYQVEEIAGGCFCCRFDSLVEASKNLSDSAAPDVFVAEPVGSCTDLVATVTYPLRRIYGEQYSIAPFSVLVDPIRAARIFGLESGRPFSEKVAYIYKKQLEEAEYIIVNKCDSISKELKDNLVTTLTQNYPRAEIFCCSVKDGTGLEEWFKQMLSETCDPTRATMELDYETYGAGEALLGWLNATIRLNAETVFNPDTWLVELAEDLRQGINKTSGEIAHMKMTLDGNDIAGKLSVVSLVRSDDAPDLRYKLDNEINEGALVLNVRAEVEPETLQRIVESSLEHCARKHRMSFKIEDLESFRPGKPNPAHRDIVAASAPCSCSCNKQASTEGSK